MKLDSSHVQYVMDCMKDNTTYVRNIKKYLLAALYNAPTTINSYYSSLVQHDMYGDGQRAVSYTHLLQWVDAVPMFERQQGRCWRA